METERDGVRERWSQREIETDRDREREMETERDGVRERWRQREMETERDGVRER